MSYLFITHDLAVVRQVVERVYVLYRGSIVEEDRSKPCWIVRGTPTPRVLSSRYRAPRAGG
ncbi:MAG: hypothetical protein ABR569_07160 [Gaiellaceae bacterium]